MLTIFDMASGDDEAPRRRVQQDIQAVRPEQEQFARMVQTRLLTVEEAIAAERRYQLPPGRLGR